MHWTSTVLIHILFVALSVAEHHLTENTIPLVESSHNFRCLTYLARNVTQFDSPQQYPSIHLIRIVFETLFLLFIGISIPTLGAIIDEDDQS